MQVALVTGASRGIGQAAAVALAARGIHVVLTARTQGGLEATTTGSAPPAAPPRCCPLDLVKEAEQLDMIGPLHPRALRPLDILVHAAGLLSKLTPVAHIMPGTGPDSLAVNATACWRLIRSTDPLLRAAPAGRALVLTTAAWKRHAPIGASTARPRRRSTTWSAPGRMRWPSTPLRVALYDPGVVATNLRAAAMPGEDQKTLRQPAEAGAAIAELLAAGFANGAVLRA
jgi:NADP-dependent 3-hydroxy acid dehydrogenase YdfG